MANINKEVNYNLKLNQTEYHAFLSLMGSLPYDMYKDLVNRNYSCQLHSGDIEKLKILTPDDHQKLYEKLNENK